jgi:hypothetical protein
VIAERPLVPVLIVSGFSEVEGLPPEIPRLAKPFRQSDLARALDEAMRAGGGISAVGPSRKARG